MVPAGSVRDTQMCLLKSQQNCEHFVKTRNKKNPTHKHMGSFSCYIKWIMFFLGGLFNLPYMCTFFGKIW